MTQNIASNRVIYSGIFLIILSMKNMKHMKTVWVPETEKQIVEKVTCDLCGAAIKRDKFSAEEVEVRHTTGDSFQEGGSGNKTSVDMCGKCFDEKLVPWLRSQLAEPRTEEWCW